MTENELIRMLEDKAKDSQNILDNFLDRTRGELKKANRDMDMCNAVKSILEEIQQYRALGTVEELWEAMEKHRAKKPIMKPYFKDMEEEYLCCPTCGEILTDRLPMDNEDFYFHCLNCGQKFDWSEEE